jgi:hypothetical protein
MASSSTPVSVRNPNFELPSFIKEFGRWDVSKGRQARLHGKV